MTTMDDTELTDDDALLLDAVRLRCGLVPDDEREATRARLESEGWSEGDDGKWRAPKREHRPDPAPVAGEIVARECTASTTVDHRMTITAHTTPAEIAERLRSERR